MASPSPSTPSASPSDLSRGLECLIGRGRFGIPIQAVHQVLSCELAPPPPLAEPWVGGIGLHEGRLLISIALFAPSRTVGHQAKAIWLTVGSEPSDFMLEVGRIATFVEARVQSNLVTIGKSRLPAFITAAFAAGSRSIGWIHVEPMLRELAGVV